MHPDKRTADKNCSPLRALFIMIIPGIGFCLFGLILWALTGPLMHTVQAGSDGPVCNRNDNHTGVKLREGVAGRVTNPDGRPVAGVLITPEPLDDPSPAIPEIAVYSDIDGWFGWPLRPGRYTLTATMTNCRPATKKVVVAKGQASTVDFIVECDETPAE